MNKWPWIIYGFFITLIVFTSLGDIFFKDSSFRTYYTILLAFDKHYYLVCILNILSILINVLAVLVVFLYAFDIKSSIKFWRVTFFIRIGLDLIGNFYDSQFIKAAFFQSIPYGLTCIGAFLFPILPSYVAHYIYAFMKPIKTK